MAQGSLDGPVRITPVIMSGGAGTRLWPLSTAIRPKQFHALGSERSMLQDTLARMAGEGAVQFLPPVIICNEGHCELVRDQVLETGQMAAAIVLEPKGRNTAAVAVIAAKVVQAADPSSLVLLLPADHVIADPDGFRAAVERGVAVARERIVTFGIEPTAPETGYGYIQRAGPLADGVYEVARFAEKPKLAVAEAYLAEGGYAWNAGIFLFSPDVMLEEMGALRPDILETASAALDGAGRDGVVVSLDADLFGQVPSESIDIAVMERTRRAAVAPCSVGWADVGSWSELWRLGPRDGDDNLLKGAAVALDSHGSLVWADDMVVAVLGVEDLVVVASKGAVVVAPKSRAQDIKKVVEAVEALRRDRPAD